MKQTFFCVHCGASLPEGAEACPVCGKRQLPPVPAPTGRSRLAMRLLADTGHTVFVSEQEAPPGIECIWEKPFTRTLDRNKGNQFTVTEKLFYLPARRHGPCTW